MSGYDGDPTGAVSIARDPAFWWACPNIWVGQPGGATAVPGQNPVGVRFDYDRDQDLFNAMAVEVFVYDPTLAAPPGGFVPHGSAVYQLPSTFVPKEDFGRTSTVAELELVIPAPDPTAVGASIVDSGGHRCLIARVYPPNTGAPHEFDVMEQHSAQRNIFIVAATALHGGPVVAGVGAGEAGTPGAALSPDDGWWRFLVDAWMTDPQAEEQVVTIDVPLDIEAGVLLESMGDVLGELGVTKVRNLLPRRSALLIGDLVVEGDKSGLSYAVNLAAGSYVRVGLLANLDGLQGGTAYAFHARQSVPSADGRGTVPAGGATVLFYRADLTED